VLADYRIIISFLPVFRKRTGEFFMKKTEDKKVTNFEEFETFYAVEVVREAKKQTHKWFCAWIVTMIALIFSNAAWMFIK
jgi:hypothetical protein